MKFYLKRFDAVNGATEDIEQEVIVLGYTSIQHEVLGIILKQDDSLQAVPISRLKGERNEQSVRGMGSDTGVATRADINASANGPINSGPASGKTSTQGTKRNNK